MIFTYVPDDASRSKWFKDQLKTLMEESKCCAFFDGCTNDSGDRRLLFAGHKVVHEEQRQQMSETLEKAEAAARAAVDWINGRRGEGKCRMSNVDVMESMRTLS